MKGSPLEHYRPWLEDIRKERPHQLRRRHRAIVSRKVGDRRRRLEPAVRRHGGEPALPFRRRGADARAAARQIAGPRRGQARGRRACAGEDARRQLARVHADHEHARQGQGNLRPLAQVRGRRRFAPPRQSRRARNRRSAGRRGDRRLSAPFASLLCVEGALVRQDRSSNHWDRNAPLPNAATRTLLLGRGARHGARRLSRLFAAHGRYRQAILRRGLDRRAGEAGQGARRLRASDDAVGAPLCARQLSRQAARRDDARPRTRPRRASGARRAQRRA